MSEESSPRPDAVQQEKGIFNDASPDLRGADGSSLKGEDLLALQDLDPALNMKMHLVNNVRLMFPLCFPVCFALSVAGRNPLVCGLLKDAAGGLERE